MLVRCNDDEIRKKEQKDVRRQDWNFHWKTKNETTNDEQCRKKRRKRRRRKKIERNICFA